MTIETAMRELERTAERLADAVSALRLTVCEDAPRADRVLLVDELCDGVYELEGTVDAMLRALPHDIATADDRAPAVVGEVNARWLDAGRAYDERIAAPERMHALEQLAARRRGAWMAWLGAAKRALTDCQNALRDVSESLYRAWSELVQRPEIRLGSASVEHLSVSGGDTDRLTAAGGATVRRLHPRES